MAAVMFDTAESIEELEKSGVERAQAKAFVHLVLRSQEAVLAIQAKEQKEVSTRAVEALDSKTEKALIKLDGKIDAVEKRLDAKIDAVDKRLDAKIDGVEQRLDAKIDGVEQRLNAKIELVGKDLLIKLGGGLIAAVTVILGAIGLAVRYLAH